MIQKFDDFILESNYVTYDKYDEYYKRGLIAFKISSEYMMKFAIEKIQSLFPLQYSLKNYNKLIKTIEDKSIPDKGIKFEFTMFNDNKIHLIKIDKNEFSKKWDLFYNNKRINEDDLKIIFQTYLEDTSNLSTINLYKSILKNYDVTWRNSHDNNRYEKGKYEFDKLTNLYSKLSKKEKYTAWELAKNKWSIFPKFNDFIGA